MSTKETIEESDQEIREENIEKITNKIPRLKHDEFFRSTAEDPEFREELLSTHLPDYVKSLIDVTNTKIENGTFIDKHLRKSIVDVLISAKLKHNTNSADLNKTPDAYIYILLEAQSKPDEYMPMRILKYMIAISENYRMKHQGAKTSPPLFPIIIYTGSSDYNVSKDLWGLFSDPNLAKQIFMNDLQVISIKDIDDEIIKSSPEKLAGFEFFSKHLQDMNMHTLWSKASNIVEKISSKKNGDQYLDRLFQYSLTHSSKNDIIEVENQISQHLEPQNYGEKAMTKYLYKVIDKYQEKTRIEIARKLLKLHPVELVSQITGLSIDQIRDLTKRSA